MKWTIDTSRLPSFVRVNTGGEPSADDFMAMWAGVIQSEFWVPNLPILIDNRNLKEINEPDKFTRAAIEFFAEKAKLVGRSCIAVISVQPDNFKYARQFQYGIRLKGADAVIQLFNSEQQALAWLEHFCQVREANGETVAASTKF
jgi:hypothetical protein